MPRWAILFLLGSVLTAAEIEWQPETRVLIAEHGGYGRIARTRAGHLLCAYSRRGDLMVKESADGGRRWSEARTVGTWEHGALANAELLVRRNGEVWCFFNRRPHRGAPDEARSAVGFFRSRDDGRLGEVLSQAVGSFLKAEAEDAHDAVAWLVQAVRAGGLASVGVESVRHALREGRAERLMVSNELPLEDQEELVRLASRHSIPIETVQDCELLDRNGGAGCLLRYRYEAVPVEA